MTQEQFNELLRSQQGELNAVLMYVGYVITDQQNYKIVTLCGSTRFKLS